MKSVLSIVRKFFFSSWVSFYYARLELTAFHIFGSVPKAASSCSGDHIARQEIRRQQEQRKAGCTGLKCFFGIAVKGFVRNLRWRIMNVMELNMSFISQVGFSSLYLFQGAWLLCFLYFSHKAWWKKYVIDGVNFLLWHFFIKGTSCLLVLRDDCWAD